MDSEAVRQLVLAGEGPIDYTQFERTVVAGVAFEDLNLARFQDYVERRTPGSIRLNPDLTKDTS